MGRTSGTAFPSSVHQAVTLEMGLGASHLVQERVWREIVVHR